MYCNKKKMFPNENINQRFNSDSVTTLELPIIYAQTEMKHRLDLHVYFTCALVV